MLELLRPGFELLETTRYTYRRPDGDERPYVYARFRRGG
jgi:hypothetical protein